MFGVLDRGASFASAGLGCADFFLFEIDSYKLGNADVFGCYLLTFTAGLTFHDIHHRTNQRIGTVKIPG
jgi:hypothetical protein